MHWLVLWAGCPLVAQNTKLRLMQPAMRRYLWDRLDQLLGTSSTVNTLSEIRMSDEMKLFWKQHSLPWHFGATLLTRRSCRRFCFSNRRLPLLGCYRFSPFLEDRRYVDVAHWSKLGRREICPRRWTGRRQVCLLTQFYSGDFSQSWIGKNKCVF